MSKSLHSTRESIEAAAAEKNLTCIFPNANEAQIDLDGDAQLNERVLEVLRSNRPFPRIDRMQTTSKSGNRHVHLRFDRPLKTLERIVIQACLGSDPVREILSLLRHNEGSDYCTALFETEVGEKQVNAFRSEIEEGLF